jgi:hypothetical protein
MIFANDGEADAEDLEIDVYVEGERVKDDVARLDF